MKHLGIVVVGFLFTSCATPLSPPPTLPDDFAWRSKKWSEADSEALPPIETAFMTRGKQWRLEIYAPDSGPMVDVFVFDGEKSSSISLIHPKACN